MENSGGRIEILQEGGDPTVLIEIPTARLRPGQDHEVEFYCADRNLRLRIDGETIAAMRARDEDLPWFIRDVDITLEGETLSHP